MGQGEEPLQGRQLLVVVTVCIVFALGLGASEKQ